MICPDCGHDNINGVDVCEACGQSLAGLELEAGDELEISIARHSIEVLTPIKKLAIVPPETTVRDAVAKMVDLGIGCLLVGSNEALEGIFTERDVLNKVSEDMSRLGRPVSEFMTANPETIMLNDSIAYGMHTMDLGGYRHLPIVDADGKPVGMISARLLMRFLCIRFADLRKPEPTS